LTPSKPGRFAPFASVRPGLLAFLRLKVFEPQIEYRTFRIVRISSRPRHRIGELNFQSRPASSA